VKKPVSKFAFQVHNLRRYAGVFGMHPNANITFQMQETKKMMETVLGIQPRATSAEGAKSPDEIVAELAAVGLCALESS
jgi:hypothetical protein